jgi:hypothetical protein
MANQKNRTKRAVMVLAVLLGTLVISGLLTEGTPAAASTPRTLSTSNAVGAPLTPIVMQAVYPPSEVDPGIVEVGWWSSASVVL